MNPDGERMDATGLQEVSLPFRRRSDTDAEQQDRALLKVVERLIIPRLAMRSPALHRPQRFGDGLSQEIAGLTDLALGSQTSRSQGVLRRLHASGASFSDLQLGLLAPSARRLGGLWLDDTVSFFDVSIATGNLQHMMRFVALDLDPSAMRPDTGRSIVVAPVPGDQHSFGAAMAAEFFRKDGWRVHYEPEPSRQSLVDVVADMWVDAVGLSVAADRDLSALRHTIAALRESSRNRRLLVVAGGEGLSRKPQLIAEIGADAAIAALDVAPRQTLRLVEALFGGPSDGTATSEEPVSRRCEG